MTDFKELREARWYCIDGIGRTTVCASEDDAKDIAASSFVQWPHLGPYSAVQLVPVDDLRGLLERLDAAEKLVSEAAAAERERCAKLCDEAGAAVWPYHDPCIIKTAKTVCENLAAKIRGHDDKATEQPE